MSDLIDAREPAWQLVRQWISEATRPVEVLAAERERSSNVLELVRVTTRSPMGAVAYETGGLVLDHGWVRVLGGGCGRMQGNLASWNGLGASPLSPALEPSLRAWFKRAQRSNVGDRDTPAQGIDVL